MAWAGVALAIYCIVQGLIAAQGELADYDDAEQLVHMQFVALNYVGAQPALYTWLAQLLSLVIRPDLSAVRAARFVCVFLIYTGVLASARRGGLSKSAALASSFGMLLLTQLGGEDMWLFSHVLAADAAMAWLPFVLVGVAQRPTVVRWMGCGALVAAALLGKYSAIFPISCLVAAVALNPEWRMAITRWSALAAPITTLSLLAIPLLWLFLNDSPYLFDTLQSKILADPAYISSRIKGLSVLAASLIYATFLWLAVAGLGFIILIIRRDGSLALGRAATPFERLLWLALGLNALLVVGLVVASGTTAVKAHWLQPSLVLLVLAATATLDRLGGGATFMRLLTAGGIVAAVVNLGLAFHAITLDSNRSGTLSRPAVVSLVSQLGPSLHSIETIVTDRKVIAGNLLLRLPDKRVLLTDMSRPVPAPASSVLLLWEGTRMPDTIGNYLSRIRADIEGNKPRSITLGPGDATGPTYTSLIIRAR